MQSMPQTVSRLHLRRSSFLQRRLGTISKSPGRFRPLICRSSDPVPVRTRPSGHREEERHNRRRRYAQTSALPFSGVIKPKPLSPLKNLTVPAGILDLSNHPDRQELLPFCSRSMPFGSKSADEFLLSKFFRLVGLPPPANSLDKSLVR